MIREKYTDKTEQNKNEETLHKKVDRRMERLLCVCKTKWFILCHMELKITMK